MRTVIGAWCGFKPGEKKARVYVHMCGCGGYSVCGLISVCVHVYIYVADERKWKFMESCSRGRIY